MRHRLRNEAGQLVVPSKKLTGSLGGRWILPLAGSGTTPDARSGKIRLFCFPNAGAGATSYRMWPLALSDHAEIYAIQPPGREERTGEQPFAEIGPLLTELIALLMPYLDAPFAFFGHSMGALICAEAARRLDAQYSRAPRHLFVSGCDALHLLQGRSRYLYSDDELIESVLALNGTPEGLLDHPEMRRLLLPLLRADFSIVDRYIYEAGPRLACPITVLAGDSDPLVSPDGLRAWRDLTIGPVDFQIFPGDHFYLHQAEAEFFGLIVERLRSN